MRSVLGKECRGLFTAMMKREFPDYHLNKTQTMPPGWYCWKMEQSATLSFFIILGLSRSDDAFFLEGAWSRNGCLPPPNSELPSKGTIVERPVRFRMFNLLGKMRDRECWLLLAKQPDDYRGTFCPEEPIEDVLPLIPERITEAMRMIREHFVPLYEEIARKD